MKHIPNYSSEEKISASSNYEQIEKKKNKKTDKTKQKNKTKKKTTTRGTRVNDLLNAFLFLQITRS